MAVHPTDASTPLRGLGTRTAEGLLLVTDPQSGYRDGGELRVREIIDASPDRSSTTDAMVALASTWAERYHLDPARANLLRAIDLPADGRVLEVGSGCGALTRYLGENCAVVDALEPVPSRAAAAQARTADLPGVEVVVATVDDVPARPTYDLVVVVGVLEYVGDGAADPTPYRHFLGTLARLLRPGGALLLAIENQLGVKYLCGAPEDHSGRPYDSVEGYPHAAPARTFSRTELSALLADAGLVPRPLIAFPDYKLTRAVFDPEALPPEAISLLYRVPLFPSPDYPVRRGPGPSEERVWRTLVHAGLAGETGNSFVVIAKAGPAPENPAVLWPAGRVGVYFADQRREPYAARTEIRRDGGGHALRLHRTLVSPDAERDNDLGLAIHLGDAPYVPGEDLLDLLVDDDDPATVATLRNWSELVHRHCRADRPAPLDLIPRNIVVDEAGVLAPIDQEWTLAGAGADAVLRRGALLTALHLSIGDRLTGRWAGCRTVADVARRLAGIVGPDWPDDWLDTAVAAEAAVQAEARIIPGPQDRCAREAFAVTAMHAALAQPIPGRTAAVSSETAGVPAEGPAVPAESPAPAATVEDTALAWAQVRIADLQRELEDARVRAGVLDQSRDLHRRRADVELARAQQAITELDAIRATTSWRLTAPLRWVRARWLR